MNKRTFMYLSFKPDFVLIDGTVFAETDIVDEFAAQGCVRRALYPDKGEAAERVGPWLLIADRFSQEIVLRFAESPLLRNGITWLQTKSELDTLYRHLQSLRYIWFQRNQYYLRYADGRAIANLWDILTPAQQAYWMGPVQAWHTWSWSDDLHEYRAPVLSVDDASTLRLSQEQYRHLLHRQRDDLRLVDCLSLEPELATALDRKQMHAISRDTGVWLQSVGVKAYSTAVAVSVVALRSAGSVLKSPDFLEQVNRLSEDGRDADVLLGWEYAQ